MNCTQDNLRVAWLVPSAEAGAYWQPILREFTKYFKHTIFYTTNLWPGFNPDDPDASGIKSIGKMNVLLSDRSHAGYKHGLMYLPLSILKHLVVFRPHVIISNAFSMWVLLAVVLKPILRWKIIILYEGSTPQSDFKESKFRSFFRKLIAKNADTFIANSKAARAYLENFLHVRSDIIVSGPYLVPDSGKTLRRSKNIQLNRTALKHPTFLFVGRLIERKGIHKLLEACAVLLEKNFDNFALIVVGDGDEKGKLQALAQEKGLSEQIKWVGWVSYEQVSQYFQAADVFVFPTFEDTWGMVVLEAMVFGQPVICSKWAGASEMITEGENGYLFDPYEPEKLADLMQIFIEKSELITSMGERSQHSVATHTPELVAKIFNKSVLESIK